jgi:hypothetical protein
MDDKVFELVTKLYDEFHEFKRETNDKLNDLVNREDNDYRVFEDIVSKLDDLTKIIENNFDESSQLQKEILENLSEKIAMLMLRK